MHIRSSKIPTLGLAELENTLNQHVFIIWNKVQKFVIKIYIISNFFHFNITKVIKVTMAILNIIERFLQDERLNKDPMCA